MIAWGVVKGKGWTQVNPADGTPLSGAPFLDACPPAPPVRQEEVSFAVANVAQRLEDARAALGLSLGPPLSDPVVREFDPGRRARPVPPRVPPSGDDPDPMLIRRLEAARDALYGATNPEDGAREDARAVLPSLRAAQARLHGDAPPTDAEGVMERARAVKEAMQATKS